MDNTLLKPKLQLKVYFCALVVFILDNEIIYI